MKNRKGKRAAARLAQRQDSFKPDPKHTGARHRPGSMNPHKGA